MESLVAGQGGNYCPLIILGASPLKNSFTGRGHTYWLFVEHGLNSLTLKYLAEKVVAHCHEGGKYVSEPFTECPLSKKSVVLAGPHTFFVPFYDSKAFV